MRLNYLLDFYQALLTPKQREYMQMYYFDDLSLVEISELSRVSRQAVYDNIKRTEAILESYEEKLLLYDKFTKRMSLLKELQASIENKDNKQGAKLIQEIKDLG